MYSKVLLLKTEKTNKRKGKITLPLRKSFAIRRRVAAGFTFLKYLTVRVAIAAVMAITIVTGSTP